MPASATGPALSPAAAVQAAPAPGVTEAPHGCRVSAADSRPAPPS